MHSEYTTIAKLISRGSKMVNAVATWDRMKHSRDAWTQRALFQVEIREGEIYVNLDGAGTS
jgi:hypothetical protein